jgi:hypothetical protein
MTQVQCSGCKNYLHVTVYTSCLTYRAPNTNWKQVVFGKSNNDTSVADIASLSLSETDSNAMDQALPPEVDHRTDQTIQPEAHEATTSHVPDQTIPPEVNEATTSHARGPQITLTLNQKIDNMLNALADTSKDIKILLVEILEESSYWKKYTMI